MYSRTILHRVFCYLSILLSGLLVSCQPSKPSIVKSAAVSRQAVVSHLSRRPILSELRKQGAHYQFVDKHLVVLIPVDRFFQPGTIHLKTGYDKRIIRIAELLDAYSHKYPVKSIQLVGYPDKTISHSDRLVLPHQYAVVVAGYLWNEGLSMRITNTLETSRDRRWVHDVLPRTRAANGVVLELS